MVDFYLYVLQSFFLFVFMWVIVLLNLLYKENITSFILSIMTTQYLFYEKYFACF